MRNGGHGLGLGLAALAVLMACGPSPEEVAELKSKQQDILGKLGDLDKKLDKALKRLSDRDREKAKLRKKSR